MIDKKRLQTFDLVKFIAIFCVLWGHIIQFICVGTCYENPFYQKIYAFHMPLFMAVVGFFAYRVLSASFIDLIKKKITQLILPGLAYSVIICIIIKYTNWGGVFDILLFSLWFLKSAFLSLIIFYICAINTRLRPYFIVISLIVSQVVYFYQFNLMYPCFLFGVALHGLWGRIKKRAVALTALSGICFVFMLIPWNVDFWIIPSGGVYPLSSVKQFTAYAGMFYYRLVIGLTGSLFFIMLCESICSRLHDNKIIDSLSSIGRETLGIYLIQTIIIEILLWRWFKYDGSNTMIFGFVIAPIASVIVLALCLIGIRILRMSKYSALLFLGEKR